MNSTFMRKSQLSTGVVFCSWSWLWKSVCVWLPWQTCTVQWICVTCAKDGDW